MGLKATFSTLSPRIKFRVAVIMTVLVITLFISTSFEASSDSWSDALKQSKLKNLLSVYAYGDLNSKDITGTPISEKFSSAEFKNITVESFVGNLDISELTISNYDQIKCEDISYKPGPKSNRMISASQPIDLKDDLALVRRELLKSKYKQIVTVADEKDMEEGEVVSKRWFRFSGGSVWLESEKLHMLTSRIVYTSSGYRDSPTVSFVRIQLFDKYWKEVKGHRIKYVDASDEDFESKFDDEEEGANEDKYSLKFPVTLNIPFEYDKENVALAGPEDPRIIWKDGQYSQEPIVVFNMVSNKAKGKRAVHAFFPLRKPTKDDNQLVVFSIDGKDTKEKEKNWTPFFYHKETEDSAHSKGAIYFIYELNPLTVIKCSLDYGLCRFKQQNTETAKVEGDLRGGTPLIPIPPELQIKTFSSSGLSHGPKNIWIGFAKAHVDACGCAETLYRPSLLLLVEEGGKFRKELMSNSIDLNMDVLSWDLTGPSCSGRASVLTPNGVSFWEVIGQYQHGGETFYTDYLGLTVTEADANVKVVYLKGVLDYILGMYQTTPVAEVFLDEDAYKRTKKATECVLKATQKYCSKYSESHKYTNS
ncbi:unnamed protein product [Kuraishia capsulata CBS 1993]|uniref:Uncharacterized protein n=1 Tax=Kuraishia capsulata CBS 1993 TaxID=1382522 RepID=W6MRG9_9ASCO|nr:uncharacterized protein KUCA_T00005334001 [Kuraishia capsulata CBS 1993]CDK29346.1 unnamed protein product [Kuraishia capsulata CBS 1993]